MPAESAPLSPLFPAALCCLAVIALVICDFREFRPGRYLFKPLAAAAFLWLALLPGAPVTAYASWLVAGLVCCMAGDLLLMADDERCFLAGLFAFLSGHLLYAMAFIQLPPNWPGLAFSLLPAIALGLLAGRWLAPQLDQRMKRPVQLYILVICSMLVCAGLSAGQAAAGFILLGAWGFALSDLAVARRQFVQPSPFNGLWGTPLYFGSQMLLAYTTSI